MHDTFNKFDLTGKTAFVTGGGTGIGYYMSRGLASLGAKVMIAARRENILEEAASKLSAASGNQVLYTAIDLSDRNNIITTANKVVEQLGGVDIFIGNAAQDTYAHIDNVDEAEADNIFQVNVSANITLAKAFLPHMRAKKWGRIIFSSSIVSHLVSAQEGMTVYAATKSAVNSLARSIAVDTGHDGITANAIVLGAYMTDMMQGVLGSMEPEQRKTVVSSLVSHNALGRFGKPEEVEGIVQLLASDAGSFITGADISVEGGWRVLQKANVPASHAGGE